jgi:hypothetical protein
VHTFWRWLRSATLHSQSGRGVDRRCEPWESGTPGRADPSKRGDPPRSEGPATCVSLLRGPVPAASSACGAPCTAVPGDHRRPRKPTAAAGGREMCPGPFSYQRYDNLGGRERLGELGHAAQILLPEATPKTFLPMPPQRGDHLGAVLCLAGSLAPARSARAPTPSAHFPLHQRGIACLEVPQLFATLSCSWPSLCCSPAVPRAPMRRRSSRIQPAATGLRVPPLPRTHGLAGTRLLPLQIHWAPSTPR